VNVCTTEMVFYLDKRTCLQTSYTLNSSKNKMRVISRAKKDEKKRRRRRKKEKKNPENRGGRRRKKESVVGNYANS